MAFVIPPGRNATLADAWAKHKAAQRAETKASKVKAKPEAAAPVTKADVHKKPTKVTKAPADLHKKAGKVHTSAKKKTAKK
jgi:hypothetical protein